MSAIPGADGWTLVASDQENEEMTLLFHYPSAFEYSNYLQPQIKIEFGRGDQQPSERLPVTPTVAETFPENFREKSAEIPVLDCQRTFWEKVTLLHAENHRPDPNKLKPRLRHSVSSAARTMVPVGAKAATSSRARTRHRVSRDQAAWLKKRW